MENFGKTDHTIGKLRKKYVENAYPVIFSNAFWYRKDELETACFDARAPRWGSWRETPHIEIYSVQKMKILFMFWQTLVPKKYYDL